MARDEQERSRMNPDGRKRGTDRENEAEVEERTKQRNESNSYGAE